MTMLMVLALAACGTQGGQDATAEATTEGAAAAAEAGAEAAPADWYKAVLEEEKTKADYPYYRLYDINQDGVDELFLANTEDYFIGGEQKACLMAYVDGEAKTLQEIGGAGGEYWIPHESDATLTWFSRLSGEGHYVRYKLEDGKLAEVSKADSYGPHHYHEKDNDEQLYFIDDKEATEDEFTKYTDEYGSVDNALTYEKY